MPGVETIAYFPWSFFNLNNLVLSFTYAALGFHIKKIPPQVSNEKEQTDSTGPNETDFYGVSGQNADELPIGEKKDDD